MRRILADKVVESIGKKVKVSGWASTIRDHGGLIFIDLRDWTGIVQIVVAQEDKNIFEIASSVGNEYVISVVGTVRERAANLVNENLKTGRIEIEAEKIEILNKSKPLPFPIDDDGESIDAVSYTHLTLPTKRIV